MSSATYKIWAPKCALRDCKTQVSYHHKGLKEDGTPWYNWKSFCEHHRTVGKAERDAFINSRGGCENRDARCGWVCGDPTTPSLTIDHWDGNKHNNDQDNLVVLCANCHNRKTKLFKDNTNRYSNVNPRFYDFFE
jgi:5-methylcytosine-specific restriction endonuclease McrA